MVMQNNTYIDNDCTITNFPVTHTEATEQKMGWIVCQLPSRMCFYIRNNRIIRLVFMVMLLLFYCEFLHYYIALLFCKWPTLPGEDVFVTNKEERPLKVMVIADTHLLGFRTGHWFDKLRREWQMERSFQTSMLIHNPDVVFVLGDVFDEGKWCDSQEFRYHVARFRRMFSTPLSTTMHVVVGNHDIGFHYMMDEVKHKRFEKAFSAPPVKLLRIRGNTFVLINSMAMEGDGCSICSEAVSTLKQISRKLKCDTGEIKDSNICKAKDKVQYSQPIILQHFPMYRPSDANCSTPDAASIEEKEVLFKEKWDCLSKESTKEVFDWINPRLVLSGHTHHGCFHVHDNNVPEWTVASFSWRNKKNPSFLLTVISPTNFSVNQCLLPHENTVITIYITGLLVTMFSLLFPWRTSKNVNRTGQWSSNKSH